MLHYNDELRHYGILGMHWGIRRYQNKDGSLTRVGKARYNKLKKSYEEYSKEKFSNNTNDVDKEKRKKGIVSVSPVLDVIKKGSEVRRVTVPSEGIDDRPKYVSILDNDSYMYTSNAIEFFGPNSSVEKRYKLTKDLRIATPDVVEQYVKDNYMDKTIREYLPEVSKSYIKGFENVKLKDLYDKDSVGMYLYDAGRAYTSGDSKADKYFRKRNDIMSWAVRKNYRDILTDKKTSMYKWLSDNGYDGIVDVEDYGQNTKDNYPVIVFNPKETMKLIGTENIDTRIQYYENKLYPKR